MGYGSAHPASWCDPAFVGTLRPNDQPGGRGPKGLLRIRGIATPGAYVDVVVSDERRSIRAVTTSLAAEDANAGDPAGAFEVAMAVTDLGDHFAAPGASALDYAPDKWGVSTLNVFFTDGIVSSANRVVKYAATYLDTHPPQRIGLDQFPPPSWDHAHPSAFIRGRYTDDTPEAKFYASEIGDVRVDVLRGTAVVQSFSDMTRDSGVTAGYWTQLNIRDFATNWLSCGTFKLPGSADGCYYVVVTVYDAWGNSVQRKSPAITVQPY